MAESKWGELTPHYTSRTFTGALTSKVMTRTNVPPNVHHRLNALMCPIALVPTVLMIPERMFTPQAIAAISTLVRVRPCPASARDAKYRATLRFPDVPVKTIAML